jgi:fucose 4-O-acetylase-like acetyltransferase
LSSLPYSIYTKSDFWLNSPALTFIKLGVVMDILAFAYLWVNLAGDPVRWSVLRQLGTTSLLVYWVHIELVYGRWFGYWKQNMSVTEILIFTICLIGLMTALSVGQSRMKDWTKWFRPAPEPQRASGD